ncbi:acyltransferase [Flavihumibacter sp. R14]|nr:acyltransferase [Flavihumibacter soli]
MNNLLFRIFQKLATLFKPKPLSVEQYVSISENTIMIGGTKLRFDNGREERKYIHVGESCLINADFIFESTKGVIEIGNNVHIGGANLICRTLIKIGNDVTMAWGITIYDHNSHSIYWENRKNDNAQCYQDYIHHQGNNVINKNWEHVDTRPVYISDKVWIGFDVTILKGITIGEGAVVGAKSVVTKDVPAWTVVAGNPAMVVKTLPNQ